MDSRIILASQSPRRKQLLQQAEIDFEVLVIPTDETYPADMAPIDIPVHIALQKVAAVQAKVNTNEVVIAADTVVVLDGTIIGKPTDEQNAIEILTSLSGNMHQVITGVVIQYKEHTVSFADATNVYFNELSAADIVHYVQQYQPYDKAGAYAIQEWIGAIGIQKIEGDFYNVMGLPINRVVKELRQLKIIP
jgi:septum formation protein